MAQYLYNITTANGIVEQLNPRYNTNNDTSISINDELKPRLIDAVKSLPVVIHGERCTFDNLPCPIWIASQYALTPNISLYFNRESQVDPIRGQLRGPLEFIDTVENLRIAFLDLRHHEETIIAQDDEVVSVINMTGTHTGNFFILPPTGNEISYEAVHLYKVADDGKIIKHKAIRDDLTFLAQLGVIKPSSPEFVSFFQALTGTTTNKAEQSCSNPEIVWLPFILSFLNSEFKLAIARQENCEGYRDPCNLGFYPSFVLILLCRTVYVTILYYLYNTKAICQYYRSGNELY
jgi:predicted ester cyclase